MSNAVPQKKTFFQIANKNFIMLFVAYTVICITHSMTNSVTSAGWRLAGMDLTTIGLIASAMSWAAFIIRPFSAPITDRGNKKLIYIAAVGALTLAVFMYSLSMDNSAFAVPAKIIHGVSWTFISTITAVIVSEYVPREDLGTAMGFFMISQMIASAVSQPVAFALAEYMGYASMLLVFTAPTKVPARLPGQSMFGGLKLNNLFAKEAISPMIINVAFQGTRTGITVFMAAFALEELGIANIGVFATAASLMGWVARPALGILLDKKGPIATLIPAGLFFSAGLLCLAFAQDLTWFIISGILIGIGQNGISPVLMTISMRTVPAERKAAANSTNYLGMDIGSALASTVGGVLCAVFGYRVGFAAFVVPVVLAVALAVVILSRLEKQERTA